MDQSWQVGTPHTLLVALEEVRSEQTRFGSASIIKDSVTSVKVPCPQHLCLSFDDNTAPQSA